MHRYEKRGTPSLPLSPSPRGPRRDRRGCFGVSRSVRRLRPNFWRDAFAHIIIEWKAKLWIPSLDSREHSAWEWCHRTLDQQNCFPRHRGSLLLSGIFFLLKQILNNSTWVHHRLSPSTAEFLNPKTQHTSGHKHKVHKEDLGGRGRPKKEETRREGATFLESRANYVLWILQRSTTFALITMTLFLSFVFRRMCSFQFRCRVNTFFG